MYHLRKCKLNTLELPVELTIANDTEFLQTLADTNQNMSSDNESDLNTEEQFAQAEQNFSDENSDDMNQQSTSANLPDKNVANDSNAINQEVQSAINIQILEQLDRMSKRLDQMEKTTCKKTSDTTKIKKTVKKPSTGHVATDSQEEIRSPVLPASIHALRQDALVQAQVEQRLLEITQLARLNAGTDSKIKSQRGAKSRCL